MKEFLDMIPAWVQSGLQVAGNMLPALGFALLMNLMLNKKVAPYFFLGFMLAAYLKLPIIAIGGLGVIIALIITQTTPQNTDIDEETEDTPVETIAVPKLTKGDIRNIFFRSLTLEANFNFETWQNTGFAFSIIPALKRLYTNKDDMAKALKRHLQLFNTSPYGSTLVFGITAAMEEQNSLDPDFDDESISSVKLGLMGPLAGVFDSLFWGTFKVIAAGVGTSLAIKGNILGPIIFILIFNIPHLLLRYNLTFWGYNAGTKFLRNLAKSNVMDKLTTGASILGLMVVGAMPATLMAITTPITIGSSKSAITVQGILDQIVPAVIPLGLTFLVYYFVRKNVKTTYLLLGLLVLGFVGSMIHLFA
jgi:PTS system mannose-specific IID component